MFLKARIKIVAPGIFIVFLLNAVSSSAGKEKSYCCDHCFLQEIRPQINLQIYILQDYSSVIIGFNVIKRHKLPVVFNMLV